MPKVHPLRTEAPPECPPPFLRQVPRHIEFKLKISTNVTHAASVLGLDKPAVQANRFVQLDVIRAVPVAIEQKRCIRQVASQHAKPAKGFGFQMLKVKRKQLWAKMRATAGEMDIKFELWRSHIIEIDGHFGPGVVSYFTFLKTLFKMNAFISILLLMFVVLPGSFLKERESFNAIENVTASESACFMEKCDYINSTTVALAPFCSANYLAYTVNSTAKVNPSTHIEILNFTEDFITGSGWMEFSAVFQGYYLSSSLDIIINILHFEYSYNLPLAYIVVTGVYMMSSLLILAAGSASAIKTSMAKRSKNMKKCSFLTFSSWNFGLTSEYSAKLVHNQIRREAKTLLAKKRDTQRRKQFTTAKKCLVYFLRLVINVFVLVMLGGASYLIVFVTNESTKLRSTYSGFLKLLVSYTPSLTLAVLNMALPSIFEKISRFEDYTPETKLNMALIRSIVVRLAGLVVLVVTLYRQVTCADNGYSTHVDVCGVHNASTPDCPQLYCWETYVGQQFYKLALMQFFIFIASTLLIEFPRRLIVTRCSFKLAQKLGQPEFNLSVNVMKLVYLQTVCWFGTFFTPVLPSMVVFLLLITFYLKKLSLLMNYKRTDESTTSSDASRFLVILLLLSFVLTMVALSYVMTKLPPSKGCGPFRIYDVMYDVVHVTMCSWPCQLLQLFSFVTSATFLAPLLFAVSVTATYYLTAVASVHKARYKSVYDQLKTEIEARKKLLTTDTEAISTESPANTDTDSVVPQQVVGKRNPPLLQDRAASQKPNGKLPDDAVTHGTAEIREQPILSENVRNKKKSAVSGAPLIDVVVESPSALHPRHSNAAEKVMVAPSVASEAVVLKNNLSLLQTSNCNESYDLATATPQNTSDLAFSTQQSSSHINVMKGLDSCTVPPKNSKEHVYSEVTQLTSGDYHLKQNPSVLSEDKTNSTSISPPQAFQTVSDTLADRSRKVSAGSVGHAKAHSEKTDTARDSLSLETSVGVQNDPPTVITVFAPSSRPRDLPTPEQKLATHSSITDSAEAAIIRIEVAGSSLSYEETSSGPNGKADNVLISRQNLDKIASDTDKVDAYKNSTESAPLSLEASVRIQSEASTAIVTVAPSLTQSDVSTLEQSLVQRSSSPEDYRKVAITPVEVTSIALLREVTGAASVGKADDAVANAQNLDKNNFTIDKDKVDSYKNNTKSEPLSLEAPAVVQNGASTSIAAFATSLMPSDVPVLKHSLIEQNSISEDAQRAAVTQVKIEENFLSCEAAEVASDGRADICEPNTQNLVQIVLASEKDCTNSYKDDATIPGIVKETVQEESQLLRKNEYTAGDNLIPDAKHSNANYLKYSTDGNILGQHGRTSAIDTPYVSMKCHSPLGKVESALPRYDGKVAPDLETSQTKMTFDHRLLLEENTFNAIEATTVTNAATPQVTMECSLTTLRKESIVACSSEEMVANDTRSHVSVTNDSLFGYSIHFHNDDDATAPVPLQAQPPTQSYSLPAEPDLAIKSSNVGALSVDVEVERHWPSASQSVIMDSSATTTTVVASSHVRAENDILAVEDACAMHVECAESPTSADDQHTKTSEILPADRGTDPHEVKSASVSHAQLSDENNSVSAREALEKSEVAMFGEVPVPTAVDGNSLMLDQHILSQNSNKMPDQTSSEYVTESDLWWLEDSALAPIDEASAPNKLSKKTASDSDLSW